MFSKWLKSILCCPECRGELDFLEEALICKSCSKGYPFVEGIINFIVQPSQLKKEIIDRYDKTEGGDSFPDSLAEILNLTSFRDRHILDIGCGRGDKTLRYIKQGAAFAVGIDVSLNGLKKAKVKLARDEGLKGCSEFILAAAEKLPFKRGVFDLVICSEVLEHVPDMDAAFAQIKFVAQSDGEIIISTPNYFNITGVFKKIIDKILYKGNEKWTGHGVETLEHFITPWKIKKILRENNFQIVDFQGRDLWNGIRPLFRVPFFLLINIFDFILSRIIKFLRLELLTRIWPFKYFGEDIYIKSKVNKNE